MWVSPIRQHHRPSRWPEFLRQIDQKRSIAPYELLWCGERGMNLIFWASIKSKILAFPRKARLGWISPIRQTSVIWLVKILIGGLNKKVSISPHDSKSFFGHTKCHTPGQLSRVGQDWCVFHQSANITNPANGQNFFRRIDQGKVNRALRIVVVRG